MNKEQKYEIKYESFKKYRLLFEIIVGIGILLLIKYKSGIFFETNDDYFISHLLSGSIISGPQIRIFDYVHIFETIPVSLLYRIAPSVPWYGIYILFCHLVIFVLPLDAASSSINKVFHYGLIVLLWCFVFISQWYIHSRVQYTSTAEMLALVGFVSFLLYKKRKVAIISFSILELLAYCMRPNAMILMLPTGVALLTLVPFLLDEKKEIIKEILKAIIVCISITIVGSITSKIAFSSDEYKHALSANNARMSFFDYAVPPEYDDVKDILNKNDISEAKYRSLGSYFIPSWDASDGTLEEISEYVNQNKNHAFSVKEILAKITEVTVKYDFCNRSISKAIVVSWIVTIVPIIVFGKYKLLIPAFSYCIIRMIGMGYLFAIDRAPKHVLLPLLFADVVVAFCLAIVCVVNEEKDEMKSNILKRIRVISLIILFSIIGFYTFKSAQGQYRFLSTQNDGIMLLNESQKLINDYCDTHLEYSYILSPEIYGYWPVDIKDTAYEEHNYIFSGGWYALLPESQRAIHDYMSSKQNLCFICHPITEFPNNQYALELLEELTGKETVLVDTIDLPTGATVSVYALED